MPTATAPAIPTDREPYRFTPAQVRQLIDAGVLTPADETDALDGRCRFGVETYSQVHPLFNPDDRGELLDGLYFRRTDINPPHVTAYQRTFVRLLFLLHGSWAVRGQVPVALPTSRPQPDVSVARGSDADYAARHPDPADLGLVVEVSDTTLDSDRNVKGPLYAEAGIAEYWIVNVVDMQVEVFTHPTPTGYANAHTHLPGSAIPLTLDGVAVGPIAVNDLLP